MRNTLYKMELDRLNMQLKMELEMFNLRQREVLYKQKTLLNLEQLILDIGANIGQETLKTLEIHINHFSFKMKEKVIKFQEIIFKKILSTSGEHRLSMK